MTEIKITVQGSDTTGTVGPSAPSSGARAPAEGATAPAQGPRASSSGTAGGSPGSSAAFSDGHGRTSASAGERSPASDRSPSGAPVSDGAGTDGAGATSSGATAREEDAHAPSGENTPDQDGATEIEGDLNQLVKKAKQRDEYLALAQRTQADFENYRKRVAREAAGAQERGVCALAKELLPALDNLDRALEAAAQDDPLLDGVRLVRSELSAALARAGIESFWPLGEAFDPSVHEAMATAKQAPGGKASGTVVEVYQPGYRMRESVIRPARVVVAA